MAGIDNYKAFLSSGYVATYRYIKIFRAEHGYYFNANRHYATLGAAKAAITKLYY